MSTHWIDLLKQQLNEQQLIQFMQTAHQSLKSERDTLIRLLDTGHIEQAVKQAHQSKSTASLISAEALVNMLSAIESNHSLLQRSDFRQQLEAAYQHSLGSLESHIK